MSYFIGLDIGTSKICAVLINSCNGELVCSVNKENDSQIIFDTENKILLAEQSTEKILQRVIEVLKDLATKCALLIKDIKGIGITGQMHGMLLVDKNRKSITNLITWEDKRCLSLIACSNHTYLDEILNVFKNKQSKKNGCVPSAGYMGCSLYWFNKNKLLSEKSFKSVFIADFIFSQLTGEDFYTDFTNAGSSGVFDIVNHCWDKEFISLLNIPCEIFPEVVLPGEIKGFLQKSISEIIGLQSGIPICCAVGDNQASLLGSLCDWNDIFINIGTGSQISCITNSFVSIENLEIRPFFDGKYILVGAGLCGGRAYYYLNNFIKEIGEIFFPNCEESNLFEKMNSIAEIIPYGCDGLICDTRFEGSRENPEIKGAFKNVSKSNFTIKHFCRSVLEGIVNELHNYYKIFNKKSDEINYITASGNAIRKNPVMTKIISKTFNSPVRIPLYEEESAYGAGLLSAVKNGAISDFQKVSELLKFKEIIYPES